MDIRQLKIGSTARITGYKTAAVSASYQRKLLSMGLLPGTLISLKHIAPLGDPILVTCRGSALTLRKDEAQLLELEWVAG